MVPRTSFLLGIAARFGGFRVGPQLFGPWGCLDKLVLPPPAAGSM